MSRSVNDSPSLDEAQLRLLTTVQDRLIPREGEMPGAGELGGAEVVAGYLLERPALHRDIAAALDAIDARSGGQAPFGQLADDDKDAVLRQVEAELPGEFETLWRQTYNSYYTNPAIQEKLGAGALPPSLMATSCPRSTSPGSTPSRSEASSGATPDPATRLVQMRESGHHFLGEQRHRMQPLVMRLPLVAYRQQDSEATHGLV